MDRVVARGSGHRKRVGVRAAVDRVDAVADGVEERVVAGAATENIGSRVAGERIVAAAASDILDAGHGVKTGGAAGAEIDGHRAGGAGIAERVARRAVGEAVDVVLLDVGRRHALDRGDDARAVDNDTDGVVAHRSGHRERVDAGAAVDRVDAVAERVLHHVVAGIAENGVVPQPADQRVVAEAAVQRVIAAETGDDIVAAVAGDDIGVVVPGRGRVAVEPSW